MRASHFEDAYDFYKPRHDSECASRNPIDLDLYHKSSHSGDRQYKSRTRKKRFDPVLRASEKWEAIPIQ